MSEYNQAIEDAATLIESNNGPQPCDCIVRTNGFWQTECCCSNYGDMDRASSWCCSANEAARVRRLKR